MSAEGPAPPPAEQAPPAAPAVPAAPAASATPAARPGLGKRMDAWIRSHRPAALGLGAGVVLLVVVAVLLLRYLSSYESTDDAQIDGHIASLTARVPGTVVAVLADDNRPVRRGELLVELDRRDYVVALARARAEL